MLYIYNKQQKGGLVSNLSLSKKGAIQLSLTKYTWATLKILLLLTTILTLVSMNAFAMETSTNGYVYGVNETTFFPDTQNSTTAESVYRITLPTQSIQNLLSTTGSISGKVYDAGTSSIIAGAKVSIGTLSAVTDTEGNYSISDIPVETYTLQVSVTGYRNRTINNQSINQGQNLSLSIALSLQSISVANIEGYVQDTLSGNALTGVKIDLGEGLFANTDNSGFYRITDVPMGKSYQITAIPNDGYYSRCAGTITAGDSLDFSLAPKHIAVNTIRGKITNSTNSKGIAKARIYGGFGITAITASDGSYLLENIPESSYNFQAFCSGYESATSKLSVVSGTEQALDFSLQPNSSTGYVWGYITNISNNSYINGTDITVGGRTVTTGRQPNNSSYYSGYYIIYGLEPGSYTLEACKDGFTTRTSGAVTVSPGQGTRFDISLTLSGTVSATLTGIVNNAVTEEPIAGARVWVSNTVVVVSDSEGHYTIPNLPTGTYSLNASQSGYRDRQQPSIPLTGGINTWNITLTPNNIAMANIEGYVRDALSGANLSGIKISLSDGMITHTDSSGWYRITDVPVGKSYPLTATAYTGYYSRCAGMAIAGNGIDFSLSPKHIAVTTVSGKIINSTNSKGISRAWVNAGFGFTALTSDDGSYALENIPEGSYYVQAYSNGYESSTSDLTVNSSQPQTLDFSLQPNSSTGNVWGYVTNYSTSSNIDGAKVTVGGKTTATNRQHVTSLYYNGYYIIYGLPPGSYTIETSKGGYNTRTSGALTVYPGQSTRFDIGLTPSGTISSTMTGIVKNAVTDEPITGASIWVSNNIVVLSDNEGHYTIPDLPTGTYTLKCSQNGYKERQQNNLPLNGGIHTWNIDLTPNNIPMANIEGYVRDGLTGGNLSGIKIRLADGMNTHTDSSGWYRISDVPVGKNYPLTAEAYTGYYPRYAGQVIAGDSFDFSLIPKHIAVCNTNGKITNAATGKGISHARIYAGFGLTAVTDADGNYTLENLPEGTYFVQAYASGFECATAQLNVDTNSDQTLDLSLKFNASYGWISGYIKNKNGTDLNGALITVAGKTVMSDRTYNSSHYYNGYYMIQGLAPGDYDIIVSKPGFITLINKIKVSSMSYTRYDYTLTPKSDEAPVAEIYQPTNGTTVGGTVNITGTASDDDFKDYKLEYSPVNDSGNWYVITDQEIVPVVLGTLTQWDTSGMTPGNYNLRLTVTDQKNNTTQATVTVTVRIPLTVTSVTPDHWVTGCKAELTIKGTGFLEGANVRVGNITAEKVTFISEKVLQAIMPEITTPGTYDMVVVNPDTNYIRLVQVFTVGQGPVVYVSPTEAGAGTNTDVTVTINVRDVANLYSGDLEVAYDPTILQITENSKVTVNTDEIFSIGAVTIVDNTTGKLRFSATRTREQYGYIGYEGSTWLARITFYTKGTGKSAITLSKAELRGNEEEEGSDIVLVPVGRENGNVTVSSTGSIAGKVKLEGVATNKNFSGNIVTLKDTNWSTVTDATGAFQLIDVDPGTYTMIVYRPVEQVHSVYLKKSLPVTVSEGSCTPTDNILLLTGDINPNNAVDFNDLMEICGSYGTRNGENNYNSNVDLNWNDSIDLIDLVLLARNYNLTGAAEQ